MEPTGGRGSGGHRTRFPSTSWNLRRFSSSAETRFSWASSTIRAVSISERSPQTSGVARSSVEVPESLESTVSSLCRPRFFTSSRLRWPIRVRITLPFGVVLRSSRAKPARTPRKVLSMLVQRRKSMTKLRLPAFTIWVTKSRRQALFRKQARPSIRITTGSE